MGLIRSLKQGIADAKRLASAPIDGSGGIVVTQSPQGRTIHNGRPHDAATQLYPAIVIDNDGDPEDPAEDFEDARYYLMLCRPFPNLATEPVILYGDPLNHDKVVQTATNIAECETATHLVPAGTPVVCWYEEDAEGVPRLVFYRSISHFNARIGASTQDGTNKRWTYDFVEVDKTSAGYGGWATRGGGRTGTAYNRFEDFNGASGLWGNGVNSSNLTGTFDIQPIPNGLVVEMKSIPVPGGAAEYWFSAMNGIDGDCT